MKEATYYDTEQLTYMFDRVYAGDGPLSRTLVEMPSTFLHHRVLILLHKLGMR